MTLSLVIPAFFAGILTFLAPCTLPLLPGYLGFISGVSFDDLKDPNTLKGARKRIFLNAVFYVIGFSLVFIGLGLLFGLGGAAFTGARIWLARIGGVFVIIFGLYMMNVLKLPFLSFMNREHKFKAPKALKPGNPVSSFVFGATFAFGWTPCVGPILGSVLLLVSANATAIEGGLLLLVFSIGLAIPFLLIALGIGHATQYIKAISRILPYVSFVGGIFLVFLGILLLTDSMGFWLSISYQAFGFINYEAILNYL